MKLTLTDHFFPAPITIPKRYQLELLLHDFLISRNSIHRRRGYTEIYPIPRFLLSTWHASLPSHLKHKIDITRIACSLLIPYPEKVARPTKKKQYRKTYCFKITGVSFIYSPAPRARFSTTLTRILHRANQ